MSASRAAGLLPALALVFNAFTWGLSWYPLRLLQGAGVHALWATTLIYVVAVAVIGLHQPRAIGQVLRTPALWVLVLASGTTNASFNWAMTLGDVVRVVLLFYLMPLWTVLLARVLLHERLTPMALLRVALALGGAGIVLWPEGGAGLPLPRSLSDWLAVGGGFSFALNNVMLRREAAQPEEARALAMFGGGAIIAGTLAGALALQGSVALPPAPATPWVAGVLALALLFLASNLALQFGAARLPANVTAVVMLTEVVFAAGSAHLLGGGAFTPSLWIGGALIVFAALLATRQPGR